jgi:hypothetical protein
MTYLSTWCLQAAFAGQPFPLNHVLPWSIRRGMCQRYAHLNSDKVGGCGLHMKREESVIAQAVPHGKGLEMCAQQSTMHGP